MPPTDIKIRWAKPADKSIKLADTGGLYLEVKPSGSKLWSYRHRIAGCQNLFAIGEYPRSRWPMRARRVTMPAS